MLFITIYVGRCNKCVIYNYICRKGNTFIDHSAISILFYYMILPPTFNQSQPVWCVFFSFFTENRVHS